jgi:hypothetical protein
LQTFRDELRERRMLEAARADVEADYQRVCKAWREQRDFIIAKASLDCTVKCAKALSDRDASLAILEARHD